ncbi:MAG: hypothetical protein ACLPLR_00075 [Terriglobales bacterium]
MKSKSAAGSNRVGALSDWKQILRDRLPLYGHRNWIVVADSAYPAQSRDGIETIVASADHRAVVETVLKMIRSSRHVKPVVYTDQELKFAEEQDAPGITSYRAWLNQLLRNVSVLPHEEIISKLDRAGQTFRVLIVKSTMTMPYTSVFFELDCAYWNGDAEKRVRAAMKN